MMPLIYTPTVGEACQFFSRIYRRPRGLFVSYDQQENLGEILANRPFRAVDVIVATDGERILGLGDLGLGGIGIPVGKLSLYTLCGGIHPARTLPIFLDVGTDNPEPAGRPALPGLAARTPARPALRRLHREVRHRRDPQPARRLLQWEDFALANARRLLERYRDRLCTFNDDIQGTAAVALAAVLAARGSPAPGSSTSAW
jgi:malate dehydrogenase (oxaloacetate-decarboxylating)